MRLLVLAGIMQIRYELFGKEGGHFFVARLVAGCFWLFLGSWVIFSGIFWFSLWLIGGLGVIFFSRTVGCFFGKEKPFFFARQNCWLLVGFWCFFLNKIFLCFSVTVDKLLPPNVKGESSEFEIFRFLEVDVPSGKQNEEVHP